MTHLSRENELNCWSCLGLVMGTAQISFCVFLGCVIAVQSVVYHNGRFTQDVVGVYENRVPFSFGRNFDFTPQLFSSWRSWTPDFHRLAGLSPFLNVPRVQVYCDTSTLTLLVDKSVSGLKLTGEEIQLGNGCFSNGELANEFVFTYGFDECGTTPMVSIKFSCSSASFYEAFTKTAPSYRWRMTWRCSPTPCSWIWEEFLPPGWKLPLQSTCSVLQKGMLLLQCLQLVTNHTYSRSMYLQVEQDAKV